MVGEAGSLGLGESHPEDKGELEDVVEGCLDVSISKWSLLLGTRIRNTYGTSKER